MSQLEAESQKNLDDMLEQIRENDELVIEENTIYEIDLECYNCLKKKEKE